MIQLILDIGL